MLLPADFLEYTGKPLTLYSMRCCKNICTRTCIECMGKYGSAEGWEAADQTIELVFQSQNKGSKNRLHTPMWKPTVAYFFWMLWLLDSYDCISVSHTQINTNTHSFKLVLYCKGSIFTNSFFLQHAPHPELIALCCVGLESFIWACNNNKKCQNWRPRVMSTNMPAVRAGTSILEGFPLATGLGWQCLLLLQEPPSPFPPSFPLLASQPWRDWSHWTWSSLRAQSSFPSFPRSYDGVAVYGDNVSLQFLWTP